MLDRVCSPCGRFERPFPVVRGLCVRQFDSQGQLAGLGLPRGAGLAARGLAIHGAPSAAAALNLAVPKARHAWVACVHQNVYLPKGWDLCLAQQLEEAERRFGPIGVAGVYGVGEVIAPVDLAEPLAAERVGWVVESGESSRGVVQVLGNATTQGTRATAYAVN
jgi:hypothetical protein